MNMKFFGAAAVAAVMLTSAPAMAATIVFDNFDDAQAVASTATATRPEMNTLVGGSFLADSRELKVLNEANLGQGEAATSMTAGGSLLTFGNEPGASGWGRIKYEGVGDIQLGSSLSSSFFFFDIAFFDLDPTSANPAVPDAVNFRVVAKDTSGGKSEYNEVLTFGFDPTLFFSQFTATEMGGADFNDIAVLMFEIDSHNVLGFGPQANLDGALNSISIGVVPVPAAGFMLFGALGGLAALRRRKTRKAA